MGPAHLVEFSLTIIFFSPFIMLVGWMGHVHYITFPFHIVFGTLIPILDISGNLTLLFIESSGLNIANSPNMTIFGVPSFIFGAGLGYVTFYFLNGC